MSRVCDVRFWRENEKNHTFLVAITSHLLLVDRVAIETLKKFLQIAIK